MGGWVGGEGGRWVRGGGMTGGGEVEGLLDSRSAAGSRTGIKYRLA